MAQHDYSIANQGFPATRADINNVLSAIATNNSGTSAPTTQYAGQFWIDTTSSTWTLYIHDGADDIQFATIDTSANTVNFTDSALDLVTDLTPELGGNLDLNSNDITGTGNINITGTGTISGDLTVDTNTLYVDSTNNRVGIGTTSPDNLLHVYSSAPKIIIQDSGTAGTNSAPRLEFKDGSSIQGFVDFADDGTMRINQLKAYPLTLRTNNVERMRIDSSGNLGIGTTTPVTPLQVNRDISGVTDALSLRANSNVTNEYIGLNFAKATHGKMSGIYGRNENSGNADGRLGFYTSSGGTYAQRLGITSTGLIFPGSDNTQDLGSSGSRFNDLYLGGGLYVGGTTSANKLDDYEEGTWTPTAVNTASWSGFASSTVNSYGATYTKVGRAVSIIVAVTFPDSTGTLTAGDHVQIGGLPFNYGGSGDNTYPRIPSQVLARDSTNGGVCHNYLRNSNQITLRVVATHGSGARSQTSLNLSFTYFTDA